MKLIKVETARGVIILTLFLLLLAFTPPLALGQEETGPPPPGQGDQWRPNPEDDLVRRLNLTPDQIDRIREIRERNREARRAIGERIREARMALDRAIYMENADESVIERRASALAEAQAAQIRLQAMTELGIRRILTPEQLETFRALRQRAERDRRDRRRFGDGRGMPPPPGGGPRAPGMRRPRP